MAALISQGPVWGQGEGPYQLEWKRETAIVGAGALSLGIGQILSKQADLYTAGDIYSFRREGVNGFDRVAVGLSSEPARQASDHILHGSYLLPALFLAGNPSRREFGKISAIYGEVAMLNAGLTVLAKTSIRRPRPFVLNEKAGLESKQNFTAGASFFSGHTSCVAANSFFAARVFTDYYPESKWKPVVWGAAIALPALTGYLRVRAGKHYPSDVITGYAVGAAVGYFIPKLHKKKARLPEGMSLNMGFSGMHIEWQF